MDVEAIAGGFIVTSGHQWWSVAWRGATPTIVNHLRHSVNPHSETGREILVAIRSRLRDSR